MPYFPPADAVAARNSGWANYSDTQYTSGSPFALSADTDTVLPNNAGSVIEAYLPAGRSSFYDGSVITGVEGDGRLITLNLVATPSDASATNIEFWYDIGGSIGELYRRILTFPKGQGVARQITLSTGVYTLDTWEANGATVYCRCNGTANLHSIRYVIHQLYGAP